MKAEAIAELDAEDWFHHHDRFSRTPAKDFYKKPVLCAAHVVGTDPYYRNLETWNVRDERERQRQATSMVRKGWNGQELRLQSPPDHGVMDRAAAQLIRTRSQTGMTTNACDVEFFLEHMDRRVGGESSDKESPAESLYNAQGMLAFERARFRADCAARAIRTAADAEKHMCRIAVARADVVRQKKIFSLHGTLPYFFLWAGGTGGARRQPANYGI